MLSIYENCLCFIKEVLPNTSSVFKNGHTVQTQIYLYIEQFVQGLLILSDSPMSLFMVCKSVKVKRCKIVYSKFRTSLVKSYADPVFRVYIVDFGKILCV